MIRSPGTIALSSLAVLPILAPHIFFPGVAAQTPLGGQCGGQGWTGSTTCGSGSVCTVVNAQSAFCTPAKPKPNFWFSLGDSYSETGFDASGTLPSNGNPLGNPPYPGRTAVGGENWVDLLTTADNNSLILTYNLAWGGATIDSTLVQSGQGVSLTDEVNTFLDKFANKPASTPWEPQNTLFSFWIGINDIGYSYYLGGDRNAFSDILMDAYFAQTGARNYLFINVPPMERSPTFLALPAWNQTAEKAVIEGYNSRLQTRIDCFSEDHSDIQLWQWDAHAAFNEILDNPTDYGFKDATSYGQNNPHYFWSGSYHPSSAAHKIFAKEISRVLSDAVW